MLIKKDRCNIWQQKYFRWFAVSTCPPGQALAGPDMTKSRLLQVRTWPNHDLWSNFICFGSEMCEIRPKVVICSCPDLPRSWFGHVRTCQDLSRRTSSYCKPAEILFSPRNYTFPFFISKFIIFYRIICFTTQTYYFQIKSSVSLSKLIILIQSYVY